MKITFKNPLLKKSTTLLFLIFCFTISFTQVVPHDLVKNIKWRGIGPGNMMGRVSAIDAINNDHNIVLIGAASGGVWLSDNGGINWKQIFEKYHSASIGDVAFFQPDPDIIWVGTGEANNRNSSAWGDGVYKSTDGGDSFQYMGLKETHQIARITTHPTDKNILYVAAVGHLWGHSGNRGLYKTSDGGNTWEKLGNGLPEDEKTGCTEIRMDPTNPDILYCAMYERLRSPWWVHSGGPNGGIYKSTNAGKTWKKLSKGLPTGDIGRVGLSIYFSNPDIIVACVETSDKLPKDLSVPGPGVYRSEDGGESWEYLYWHATRPLYHGRIEINPLDDNLVYVINRDYRMSRDGGKTFGGTGWRGSGGDDHDLWISPNNKDIFYTGTDQGAHLTEDGGRSFRNFANMNIGQYYAIGTDMRDPYWVYGGLQDNGSWSLPSKTRDSRGIINSYCIKVAGGDGFQNLADPENWRNVYSVAHVGYLGVQNIQTGEKKFITPSPETITNFEDYKKVEYEENLIDYTIDPGEHWLFPGVRARSKNGSILPAHFRFNWNTPLAQSPNNAGTIYFGSNYLFKSDNRGESWSIISHDLTSNDPEKRNPSKSGGLTREVVGAENHCTIVTICESPVDENIIWIGTDDGNVQITQNAGNTWKNLTEKLSFNSAPNGAWVSRVEASHFDEGTAYVTYDDHRRDNNKPYVFKTTDFGESWINISSNLPIDNAVYVIKEDYVNKNLLFVGTEFACYTSINGGNSWEKLSGNMPTVAYRDLVIHPRDADLIAGTHGRSIWILDDITPLQQLNEKVLKKELHLFKNRIATIWDNKPSERPSRGLIFEGENPPEGAVINFYIKDNTESSVNLVIMDANNNIVHSNNIIAEKGINRYLWNQKISTSASIDKTAEPGEYKIKITVGDNTENGTIILRKDPGIES